MHDHTYRMAVCWQNTAYNQPPHLGYNLAAAMAPRLTVTKDTTVNIGEPMSIIIAGKYLKGISLVRSILPDGTSKVYDVPDGFERENDFTAHTITVSGIPQQAGDYLFALQLTGLGGQKVADTLVVHVVEPSGIEMVKTLLSSPVAVFDLSGHRLTVSDVGTLPEGVYIVRRRTAQGTISVKVVK